MNLSPPANEVPPSDWHSLVEQSWPAITASELLLNGNEVWDDEGLRAPKREEAVALAAAGRLVRYGQSVCLNLPISREPTVPRLGFYLHRLRLDAAGGLIRSSWLNSVTIAKRNDLIVFGRTRNLLRSFSTSSVMRPKVIDERQPLESADYQRTLLINGHGDLLATLELLAKDSHPFAIVVQTTPQGCDENSLNILKALPEFFPDVPVVAVGFTGQMLPEAFPLHAWNSRVGDIPTMHFAPVSPSSYTVNIEIVAARDSLMDAFVKKLGLMVWNLKSKMEETGGSSQELSAMLAVDRALRCLNVPLKTHEQGTARHARGGRFPIRTIESWLEIASRLKGRRGDIQDLHTQILFMVRNALKDLHEAKPGRSEAIIKLCGAALKTKQHVSVLVGTRRDAEILQNYIEVRLGPEATDFITTTQMDGATASAPDRADLVIFSGVLYPSRIHWLGLDAKRRVVLCHPFEQQRISEMVDRWWKLYGLPSHPTGDKRRLWSLDWPVQHRLSDIDVDGEYLEFNITSVQLLEIDGEYPPQMRVATLDSNRGFEDWLSELMTEPPPLPRDEEIAPDLTREVIVLHLEGLPEPIRWTAKGQILKLGGEELIACTANDIEVGDELVLLLSSDERVATQRDLFEMFVDNSHGLSQILRIAEKWQDFVDVSMQKLKSAVEVNKYLRSKKYEVHNTTVQNWAHRGVIGPQNPIAIRLLADLIQIPDAERMAGMVANAIQTIRNEHRRIGTDLRRAITISRNRDISAVQIGSRRFSRDVFDSMVQIARVVRIERPSQEQTGVSHSRSVKDVALDFAMRHQNKVIFTSSCERSMSRSPYADLGAFSKVLNVLVEGFHPMYATHARSLKEVEDMLRSIPASYAGAMSDITKGKTDQTYFRIYDGQRVDISKHIKLGRAFDPRYTLRLHFSWDAEREIIVVHHAGEHLQTLSN